MLAGGFCPPQDSHPDSTRVQIGQVQRESFGTGIWQDSLHFAYGFDDEIF
jgi:hypothetical protein